MFLQALNSLTLHIALTVTPNGRDNVKASYKKTSETSPLIVKLEFKISQMVKWYHLDVQYNTINPSSTT